MNTTIGLGLAAVAATATLAYAGGGDGDKDKDKSKNTATMEKMGGEPQGDPTSIKAKAGEGITFSVGEDFDLTLKNRVQVLWRYSALDGAGVNSNSLSIRRARTALSGHVYDKTKQYKMVLDWTLDSPLLDAYFNWDFWRTDDDLNQVGLRLGQQKAHHGREFQGSSEYLEFVERSLASRTFAGNRVVGAYVHGDHLEGKKLHWWAGIANSDPAAGSTADESGNGAANTDNEVNFLFDLRLDPFGDYGDENCQQGDLHFTEEAKGTIGASLLVGNHRQDVTPGVGPDIETTSVNIYTAWKVSGFHVLGEIFIRSDDPGSGAQESDHTGWAVGGSYTLPPAQEGAMQWGFGVRYSMVDNGDPSNLILVSGLGGAEGDVGEIEAVINAYYHEHRLKTQVGYRHQMVDPDGIGSAGDLDNDFLDLMFQFVF